MLTSFFSKSKPVNVVTVVGLMATFFLMANFKDWFGSFEIGEFFEKLSVLFAFILSVMVLNFIAKKNELTRRSAYKILLFAIFSTSFFALLRDTQVIVANLCVLFALRRIISLKSQKVVRKKIFDATFWICIGSLFYFWTILFLIIVFGGIMIYAARLKNWLIPPVAFLCVAILTATFHLLVYEDIYTLSEWFQASEFNFDAYRTPRVLIPLSIILSFMLWTFIHYLGIIQRASVTARPLLNLIIFILFTGVAVALFAPTKDGSELIFFFVPLSIIGSSYFDSDRDKIFREVMLAILILMPLCMPLLF
ncbi:DUF6427 family protein [Salegentibacter chungangensis]|uniref:DUF6427 family protein n=1 Tax=Salegentibacter chungangensis TaxID=1335724 RepID=A0ABW3NLD8_9FLAO